MVRIRNSLPIAFIEHPFDTFIIPRFLRFAIERRIKLRPELSIYLQKHKKMEPIEGKARLKDIT